MREKRNEKDWISKKSILLIFKGKLNKIFGFNIYSEMVNLLSFVQFGGIIKLNDD